MLQCFFLQLILRWQFNCWAILALLDYVAASIYFPPKFWKLLIKWVPIRIPRRQIWGLSTKQIIALIPVFTEVDGCDPIPRTSPLNFCKFGSLLNFSSTWNLGLAIKLSWVICYKLETTENIWIQAHTRPINHDNYKCESRRIL